MTTTEISKAYAELHEKWPELRPDGIIFQNGMWLDIPSEHENDGPLEHIAHAACFMACLKACAERAISIHTWNRETEYDTIAGTVYVNERDPHSITAIMPQVMALPRTTQ